MNTSKTAIITLTILALIIFSLFGYSYWKFKIQEQENTFYSYTMTKKGAVVYIVTSYPNSKDPFLMDMDGKLYEIPSRKQMLETIVAPETSQNQVYELEMRQIVWDGWFNYHIVKTKVVGAVLMDAWHKKKIAYWVAP